MKNLSRVILVFVLLLLVTSIASAGGPRLESFSTTGYTLFYPPELAPEFETLPSGDTKFHLFAQGDTGGFFNGGSFTFEEWGVYYPETEPVPIPPLGFSVGANHGLLNIITDSTGSTYSGEVSMRFGGQAVLTFEDPADPFYLASIGSFTVLDGTGDYTKLKGQGTYDGDADFVFTVDYTPCKKGNCQRCAVFGEDKLEFDGNTLEWTVTNEGNKKINIQNITINWPADNGVLKKVKLGGKTLEYYPKVNPYPPIVPGNFSIIDLSGWEGKKKDIQIKNGKQAKLTFEFKTKYDDAVPSDYTILVEFAEGCAVTFVAF